MKVANSGTVGPNSAKWQEMAGNGTKWHKVAQHGRKWEKMGQWGKKVLERQHVQVRCSNLKPEQVVQTEDNP